MKNINHRFKKLFLNFSLLFLALNITSAAGQAISIKEILERPDRFNGRTITVEGELIGEALKAKDGVWINILQAGANFGIFVSDENLLPKIKHWGSYKEKGDAVRITGKFYPNCLLHKEQDIHAQKLEIIAPGSPRSEYASNFKIRLAFISFVICLVLAGLYTSTALNRKALKTRR